MTNDSLDSDGETPSNENIEDIVDDGLAELRVFCEKHGYVLEEVDWYSPKIQTQLDAFLAGSDLLNDPLVDFDDGSNLSEAEASAAEAELHKTIFDFLRNFELKNGKPQNFRDFWDSLESFDLSKDRLTKILDIISRKFATVEDKGQKQKAQKLCLYMADNFSKWRKSAIEQIDGFNLRDTERTLNGLMRLRIKPSAALAQGLERQVIKNIEELKKKPSKLVNILHCMVFLEMSFSDEFMNVVPKATINAASNMNAPSLGSLLRNAAVISALRKKEKFREVGAIAKGFIEVGDLDPKKDETPIRQFATANLWFGWQSSVEMPIEIDNPSKVERDLSDAFNRLGIETGDDYIVEKMKHKIDIVLKAFPHILIEVDGPDHLLWNTDYDEEHKHTRSFDAKTLFQSLLINKSDPDKIVVRITAEDARKIISTIPTIKDDDHPNEATTKTEKIQKMHEIVRNWLEEVNRKDPGCHCTMVERTKDGIDFETAPLNDELVIPIPGR